MHNTHANLESSMYTCSCALIHPHLIFHLVPGNLFLKLQCIYNSDLIATDATRENIEFHLIIIISEFIEGLFIPTSVTIVHKRTTYMSEYVEKSPVFL